MRDDQWIPSASYPALTLDRLQKVANLIRRVRRETAALHMPEDGDNDWSLGCRAYARVCNAIRAATDGNSWLTVVADQGKPLRFIFAIGGIPIRFYRGQPGDPPSHYLTASLAEQMARQKAFDFEGIPAPDRFLRIAVDTLPSGEASTIALVEFAEPRSVLHVHRIPESPVSGIAHFPIKKEGVALPPPEVEPIEEQHQKEDDAS